jgi:toxin ParE1/3/4
VRVVWSSLADRQVTEAVAFIASDRPVAARRWLEGLLDQVRSLATFPDSGRVVPELEQDDIRELFLDPYRVVYRRCTDLVEIVTVWHMRREFPVDALE